MRNTVLICAWLLATAGGLVLAAESPPPSTGEPTINVLGNPSELDKLDPIQFLDMLKTKRGTVGWMTFQEPVSGWVRAEHIPKLIALLNSTEECRPVVMSNASVLPSSSTVGKEAAMMIAGFRDGRYPSVMHAGVRGVGTPAELIAWWKTQSAAKSTGQRP